jgi:hypothetical protein
MLVLQPGANVLEQIINCTASRVYERLQIAVAFATEQGVDLLFSRLALHDWWEEATKTFLVGIDHGLTQPEALDRLVRLPNAELRVPDFDDVMTHPALARGTVFHPKLYCFSRGQVDYAILVGSSNLTGSGLVSNVEAAALVCADFFPVHERRRVWGHFMSWWDHLWDQAAECTPDLIASYSNQRRHLRRQSPDRFLTEEPSPTELAAATSFWIEAGFLSGGSSNQLELPNGVETFFGVPTGGLRRAKHPIILVTEESEWEAWIQFWGNQVWRLRLPTEREGLGNYAGLVICFHKTHNEHHFLLELARPTEVAARGWSDTSRERGALRRTRPGYGGRDYGWF